MNLGGRAVEVGIQSTIKSRPSTVQKCNNQCNKKTDVVDCYNIASLVGEMTRNVGEANLMCGCQELNSAARQLPEFAPLQCDVTSFRRRNR